MLRHILSARDWNTTGKSNCSLGDVRIFLRVSKKKEENLPNLPTLSTLPKIVEGKLGQEDKSGMGTPPPQKPTHTHWPEKERPNA